MKVAVAIFAKQIEAEILNLGKFDIQPVVNWHSGEQLDGPPGGAPQQQFQGRIVVLHVVHYRALYERLQWKRMLPRIVILAGLLMLPLCAEEKWTYVRSGPFEVWTDGGDKQARLRLVEAEQFRHALGSVLGKDDLKSVWRIRLLATKDKKRGAGGKLHRVRDMWSMTIPLDEPLPADFRRDVGRILLDSNCRAFSREMDQAIIDLLSPLEVNGTRLHLGVPEPAARTLAWARVHLFVTEPELAGRSRVFFSNLESGGDMNVAIRNAFSKPVPEIEKLVAEHFKLGDWPVRDLPGRAMSEKDFSLRLASPEMAALARADIGEGSYKDLDSPEAFESAGDVAKAVEAGSKSATAWFGLAQATKDPAKARVLLAKAAELNPLWGEPHAALAKLGGGVAEWSKAAQLDLRNVGYWQTLAETYSAANQFNDAAKAWNGAQRAAADEAERDRMRAARAQLEEERADFAASDRKRVVGERAKDLDRVKNESLTAIREAEAKANAKLDGGKAPVGGKVEQWWDGPGGPKQTVSGMLQRVDCLKGPSRLVVKAADGKLLQLLIADPTKVAILNGKEQTLGCGAQNPARKITVEYQPAQDAKTATAGTVLTIEFRP